MLTRFDTLLWYGAVSMNSSAKPKKYGFIHYGGCPGPGPAQLSFTRNGMDVLKKKK